MDTLKKILVPICVVVFFLCVGACYFMVIRYADLQKKYDTLAAKLKEKEEAVSQAQSQQSEAQSNADLLRDNLEQLQSELAQMTAERDRLYEQLNEQIQESESAQIQGLEPGDVITEPVDELSLDQYFYASDIEVGDKVYERINGKSYRENDNIALSDLCYLKLLHYNFDHQIQVGEMVVNRAIADEVLAVFKDLYRAEYEIQSVFLIDNYWSGDGASTDSASIDVNNTSCFNYREVTGGSNLSNHAYGRAIDINPQQNPYVRFTDAGPQCAHANAVEYIDRTNGLPHVIVSGDVCETIFKKYGFEWGGDWSDPKDYQHFEKKYY